MKQRRLGNTGIQVSELCLGAMNFGNVRFGVDEAESRKVIDAYLGRGGNFIDTADAYSGGVSEEIVGRAIRDRRESVILATKGFYPVTAQFGDPPAHANALGASRRHLTAAIDASLKRLGTDYIDLYQVHCWDEATPIEETLSTLDKAVHQGKVRYVGLSNYSAWQIAESRQLCIRHGWEPYVTAQMQYSLICRDIEADVVPVSSRYGIGLLPWSPLGQGVLTGKYRSGATKGRFAGEPANAAAAGWRAKFLNERTDRVIDTVLSVAESCDSSPTAVSLAWLLTRPAVNSIIIGPRSIDQLDANLAATSLILPMDALSDLDSASAPAPRYPEWFIGNSPRRK